MAIDKQDIVLETKVLGGLNGLQEQFKIIAENMRSAILTFDMNKRLTFVNKAFRELTSYEIGELDFEFINCLDSQDQDRIRQMWLKTFEESEFVEEVSVITKCGKIVILNMFCHPLLDEYGVQVGVYLRLADLWKYKQDEYANEQIENNIRRAIFSAPFPAIIVTQKGETIEVNKKWSEMTGDDIFSIPNFRIWMDTEVVNQANNQSLFEQFLDPELNQVTKEIKIQGLNQKPQVWQLRASRIGLLTDGTSLYLFMGVDLTDRKNTEARLIDSEKKLRLVTNNIKSAVIAYNNNKDLIYVNPGFENLTGSKKSINSLKLLLTFVHPKDLKYVTKIIRETYKGKSFIDAEFRILVYQSDPILKQKNATQLSLGNLKNLQDPQDPMESTGVKWVSSSWRPLLDDDGKQIGIQIRITDTTESRKIKGALKVSEANFRAILNNTSQCFMLVSKDYRVKTFNKIANTFAQRVYGIGLTQDFSLKKMIAVEDELDFKNCFEFALQGYPITIERNIKGSYKKDNWFEMSFVPVYEGAAAISSVCVGILDISIRKKANQILEASEKRFKSLVQNSSDLTSIIDRQAKIKYLSPAVKNIFGYKPGKLLFNNYLEYIHPDDRVMFMDNVEIVIGKEPVQVEYRFKNQLGEWVYLQSIITDLLLEPSIRGIVINSRDITQTNRAQQDLNESKHFIQRIADSMPNILFLYEVLDDYSYQLIYVNQSLQSVLGYDSKKVVLQNNMKYENIIHPDDLSGRADVLNALQNGTEDEVIETELRVKDNDKQWRWMYVREVIFSRDKYGKVKQILGTAEDITRRKHVEDQLAKGALYDTLTGLPNRRYFLDKLTSAIKRQTEDDNYNFAVLFLDVDRFKIINDSLGHDIGDQLLIAISQRLRNSVSETDFVARLGGDEFTILMEWTKGNKQIMRAVDRIQQKINVPFTLHQRRISTTCSIGIAPSSKAYREPESMLRDADTAMYRAKNRGKNCYAIFNKQMHALVMKVLQTEGDLRRAISNHELEIYYQPLFDLKSGNITSCEALLRWNHPQNGLTLPGEFLSIAEETGLMQQLDKFALYKASQQNYAWQEAGLPDIRVAVNLSLNEVRQKKVKELVSSVLKQTKLQPRYLEIELTENILIDLTENSLETLKELRKMGVSMSIDDFGTGYSSLTYIKRLPLNYLKIDQSFTKDVVTDPSTAAIVKSIIDLSHVLNIKVVAEGVESQDQLDWLKTFGCDKAQGYLLGKPMPAQDFEKLLRKQFDKNKPNHSTKLNSLPSS
jgi:diguanylate cyclase (GGDEF)-like protein/PAS domain S-box-containing protein